MSTLPSKIVHLPPRREPQSKILRYMDIMERADIIKELHSQNTEWNIHPEFDPKNARANVFKEGRSSHIYNTSFDGIVLEDKRAVYPKTLSHISKWTDHDLTKLGRTYWHRLLPGQRIELHHDNSNGYFRTVHRYHLYLDVPFDFHVILDGKLWNVYDEYKLTNAVVQFNLFDYHFFVNYTEAPVYLLVFDFYP